MRPPANVLGVVIAHDKEGDPLQRVAGNSPPSERMDWKVFWRLLRI